MQPYWAEPSSYSVYLVVGFYGSMWDPAFTIRIIVSRHWIRGMEKLVYILIALGISSPRDPHRAPPTRNHLDRRRNQPPGSRLLHSPYPSIPSKPAHPALRHAQSDGRLSHRHVGKIVIRDFGLKLKLDWARLIEGAYVELLRCSGDCELPPDPSPAGRSDESAGR